MNADDKQPDEKKTVEIAAVPEWAVKMTERILSELGKTNANIALVSTDMGVVKERLGIVEDWKRKLEQGPSIPPPPPLTSERVRAVIDGHPSQMDLKTQAELAETIAKDIERDRKIAETHEGLQALAATAATKDDVAKLAADTATKAEVKTIADAQTTDIVTSLEKLAARNKTVRNLLIALGGLAFLAVNAATTYLMRPPAPQPTQIQVTK